MPNPPLPPLGHAAIVRALARRNGNVLPEDATTANLAVERVRAEDLDRMLPALLARARRLGAGAPVALLGDKQPCSAVLASGDHLWRLSDRADGLLLAIDALADRALALHDAPCGLCGGSGILV